MKPSTTQPNRHPVISPRSAGARAALLTAAIVLALAPALAPPALAGPTEDPDFAAVLAGGYVERQIAQDGSVTGFSGGPDVGATVSAALALAAAQTGIDAFERAVGYATTNRDAYAAGPDGADLASALANLVLLADAAGTDPTGFGEAEGGDLVARLEATLRTEGPDAGLYGAQDPAFDGVFRQSLALLAIAAADRAPDPAALGWLRDQQCDSGAYPSYRTPEDRDTPCPAEASDSNSTALAVQALAALDEEDDFDAGAWLDGAQNTDGGLGFAPGSPTDANSTALAVQAIVALGEDPSAGRWADAGGNTPLTALLALQLGCEAASADRGAFAFQPEEDGSLTASPLATYQAAWGAARLPFPFGDRTGAGADGAIVCPLTVSRQAGASRVDTAVSIARTAHPEGAQTVVVANAFGYADALAGAPLARSVDGPILLTPPDALPEEVAAAVRDLGATEAVLLGGPAAVSETVSSELQARTGVAEVERIGGANRFATAEQIAARVGGGDVYVTEGADADPTRGWPDSLAVAALAAFQDRPVLLVTTDDLPEETARALQGRPSATVVGGPAAVDEGVLAAVDAEVGEVTRVAGANRYGTALEVTRLAREAGMTPSTSWLATGNAFADALAAGPAAAREGALLMLVDGQDYDASPATGTFLREVRGDVEVVRLAGGPAAISQEVADRITREASGG